jgi:hypothetical protein
MTSKIERVSTEREPPVSTLVSTTASVGKNTPVVANAEAILETSVSDRGPLEDLSQSTLSGSTPRRKWLILKRRDVRVVEGARLESGTA